MVNTFVFSTCLYLFKEIIKKKLSGYEVFFVINRIFVGKKGKPLPDPLPRRGRRIECYVLES